MTKKDMLKNLLGKDEGHNALRCIAKLVKGQSECVEILSMFTFES